MIFLAIFVFFSPHLFLSLCGHPLLAVNALVSSVSGNPLLKSSLPSIRTVFGSCPLPTNLMLSSFKLSIITHCGYNFWIPRCDSKSSTNIFFLLHNFTDRIVVLTIDLSNLSIQFFSFLMESVYLSLNRSTLQHLYGISELPTSLLLHFGAIIK